MASDHDFNRKSFTTAHTGFSVPFTTWSDRSDVPYNAARSLRYIDRFVTIKQGSVFYITEMLAQIEGLERGPAGNTSLAAAFAIAQEMSETDIIVVQETEYTGAGKHPWSQLNFASKNGIDIINGDPEKETPGKNIILPEHPCQVQVNNLSLEKLQQSYFRNAITNLSNKSISEVDINYLAEETHSSRQYIINYLSKLGIVMSTTK